MRKKNLKAKIAELEAQIADLECQLEIANRCAEMMRGYQPYIAPVTPSPYTPIQIWPDWGKTNTTNSRDLSGFMPILPDREWIPGIGRIERFATATITGDEL